MQNILAVVGEHRDDPAHLLVRGPDGQHYDLDITDGDAQPIEPDDEWELDPLTEEEEDELLD